jgi:hypothetical protein
VAETPDDRPEPDEAQEPADDSERDEDDTALSAEESLGLLPRE